MSIISKPNTNFSITTQGQITRHAIGVAGAFIGISNIAHATTLSIISGIFIFIITIAFWFGQIGRAQRNTS